MLERRWISSREVSRIVIVAKAGQSGLRKRLGMDLAELRAAAAQNGQDSSLTKTVVGLPSTVSGQPAPLTFCSGYDENLDAAFEQAREQGDVTPLVQTAVSKAWLSSGGLCH